MKLDALSLEELGRAPWADTMDVPASAPPARCAVIVVGAGIAGLSTALTLSERSVPVIVLDRQFGGGATGRSGGIVLGDTLVGPAPEFAVVSEGEPPAAPAGWQARVVKRRRLR